MSFLKDSIKEFDHVVWPTRAETIKYFNIVVSMIVALTIFLFIVGTIFSTGLFEAKKQISPAVSAPAASSVSEDALKNLKLDGVTASGSSGKTAAPAKK